MEIVTFGKIAGINASEASKTAYHKNIVNQELIKSKEEINALYSYPNLINFYFEKERISNLLFKNLGWFRNKSQMDLLLEELKKLKYYIFLINSCKIITFNQLFYKIESLEN